MNLLLINGADARVHPVTKYSPLYIACYNGHKEIAELLLRVHFIISISVLQVKIALIFVLIF